MGGKTIEQRLCTPCACVLHFGTFLCRSGLDKTTWINRPNLRLCRGTPAPGNEFSLKTDTAFIPIPFADVCTNLLCRQIWHDHEVVRITGSCFLQDVFVPFLFRPCLRWLKPVPPLSRDSTIRRIDSTTLYHITGISRYHTKCQLLFNRMRHYHNIISHHSNRWAL